MAQVTVTIPNSNWTIHNNWILWNAPTGSYLDLGSSLSGIGGNIYLGRITIDRTANMAVAGRVDFRLASSQSEEESLSNDDFSSLFESQGVITLTASDGSSVRITGGTGGDVAEPYRWTPSNAADVAAFADTVAGLTDRSLTVNFNDTPNEAPEISAIAASPTSVENGGDVTLTATTSDPDSDPLTYSWRATPNVGTFSDAAAEDTTWTAHSPTFQENVVLTLTVDDDTVTTSDSVTVTVEGVEGASAPSGLYSVLVDVAEDGSYVANIIGVMSHLRFSAGADGARRQRIDAVAGKLTCKLHNTSGLYAVADFEDKPIRVLRHGLYLWGGVIDDVEEVKPTPGRRELVITAFGRLTAVGGTVPADISESGSTLASQAVEELTGLDGLDVSSQSLEDWSVGAGADILEQLRVAQDNSGTRIYEDGQGDIQLAGQGAAELWDITIADEGAQTGDKPSRRFRRESVTASIVNAVIINGTKYTDSDSVAAHGEHLYPNELAFVETGEEQAIAGNLFALYADRANLYSVRMLLEDLAGRDRDAQNDVLRLLHYGNERILRVREEGEIRFVEVLKVGHTLQRGPRHLIDLQLRERDTSGLSLNICTYYNGEVGYFLTLPPTDTQGRAITGHKIEYRKSGETAWQEHVSVVSGLILNSTFTIGSPEDGDYEVRAIATNAHGDQQTSPTQTIKVSNIEAKYRAESAQSYQLAQGVTIDGVSASFVSMIRRSIGLDAVDNAEIGSANGRIGWFDVEYRFTSIPNSRFRFRDGALYRNPNKATIQASNPITAFGTGPYQVTATTTIADIRNQLTGQQFRFRPAYFEAGAVLGTAPRGYWSPWIDAEDITVTY